MKNLSTKSGFSLIEIIIYATIFSLLAGVVINSFVVTVGSYSDTKTYRDLQESGITSMERITREIRQANSVTVANSNLGTSPGTLELATTDSSGANATVKFVFENNGIFMYKNGTLAANLLGQNVIPTNLIFRRIVTTNGTAVKVEMTLQDNRGKAHKIAKFYDTIILRGDY